jgi:hypothetical protein
MWLAINKEIFQHESKNLDLVASRDISLLVYFINVKGFHHYELQIIEQDEDKWLE